MKVFAAILGLFISTSALAESKHTFMPDNDLWMEDSLSFYSAVDQTTFNDIVKAGVDSYLPVAQANKEKLVINALWTNSTVNANACRGCKPGEVTINMYGGLARRVEVIPEGFALVLCHELSHAYGGTPYIQVSSKMSAEGQSDYMATKECYNKIAAKVPVLKTAMEHSEYINQKCDLKYAEASDDCKHALEGGLSLAKLLAVLMEEPIPQYETPDKTVVSKTQLSYPATVQCRADSYHNGALDLPRPLCWFKPESKWHW